MARRFSLLANNVVEYPDVPADDGSAEVISALQTDCAKWQDMCSRIQTQLRTCEQDVMREQMRADRAERRVTEAETRATAYDTAQGNMASTNLQQMQELTLCRAMLASCQGEVTRLQAALVVKNAPVESLPIEPVIAAVTQAVKAAQPAPMQPMKAPTFKAIFTRDKNGRMNSPVTLEPT